MPNVAMYITLSIISGPGMGQEMGTPILGLGMGWKGKKEGRQNFCLICLSWV